MSIELTDDKKNTLESAPLWIHKWKSMVKYHKPIAHTNIIPWKVPLDSSYSEFCSKYDNHYNLERLLEELQNEDKKISMIMDLNQSDYYYSRHQFRPENRRILFEEKLKKPKRSFSQSKTLTETDLMDTTCELAEDIVYVKAPISTTCLTKDKIRTFKEVFAVLDEFVQFSDFDANIPKSNSGEEETKFDCYVLVHCFHGLNRTGAVLCKYIKEKFGITMKKAIKLFEEARLHKLEYEFTMDMLYDL